MVRTIQQRKSFLALCVILAALPLLAGCGTQAGSQPEGREVKVSINDQAIELPDGLSAGMTTFTVTNTGSMPHGFAITGPTGEMKLEKILAPGESGTLKVGLDTGTYRVYSPTPNAAGTMEIALVVQPPAEGRG